MNLARFARYGAVLLVLGSVVPSHASPVLPGLHQLVITGQAAWSGTAINWIGSENYTVTLGPSEGLTDFFTFDLTSLSGPADGAVLRLVRYWTGGPELFIYLLGDPWAVLLGTLGPGSIYGGIVGAGPGALGDILEIPLNADGIAAINASQVMFSMGGMLVADPVAETPEPATLLLVGAGLLAVGYWGGRRKRSA